MTPYLEEESGKETLVFSNQQVRPYELPTMAILEYSPLEKNLLKSDLIFTTIFFGIGAIVALVLRYAVKTEFMIRFGIFVYLGIGLLALISAAYTYFEFKKRSYAIRQRDVVFNKGLFWQSSTVIPFNRVQHCEVSQGPIDRLYGLAELKVFTAGGASSDLQINGLSPETATRIKDFIVAKTTSDEEE